MKATQFRRDNPIVHCLLAGFAVVLLSLVLWQNRDTIREVLGQRLDLRWLGLGFLTAQISLLITFFRWSILVQVIEPRITLRASVLLGFIGYVFNLVIPGAVGGDLVKAAYLARMHIKKAQAISSMVIDRILGLIGLFILAAIGGALSWGTGTPRVRGAIVVAWVGLGLGMLLLVAIFGQWHNRFPHEGSGSETRRLWTIMTELRTMSTAYRQRLDVVLVGLGLSVIIHGLNVLVFFTMSIMLFPKRMTATLAQHFLMVPLTLLTMAIPLPLGALGLTEGVGDELFKLVGHPSGALAMIGLRALGFGCGLVGACVYLANLNELRALTQSAHHLEDQVIEQVEGEDTGSEKPLERAPAL